MGKTCTIVQPSRANRREDSGKSTPETNHANRPHPIASPTELNRNCEIESGAVSRKQVIAAPATTQTIAIH